MLKTLEKMQMLQGKYFDNVDSEKRLLIVQRLSTIFYASVFWLVQASLWQEKRSESG